MDIDETVDIEATVTPANAEGTVEWVAVDGTGKVTVTAITGTSGKKATIKAVSAGTAQINKKSGTIESAKLTVTVNEPYVPEPEDYASDVVGTYYGEGTSTGAMIGAVTDVKIVLERVDNGEVSADITVNLPMVGKSNMSCSLNVLEGYKLEGSASMPNPLGGTLTFAITGEVNPEETTINMKLDAAPLVTINLSATMADLTTDVAGTYKGDGQVEGLPPLYNTVNGTVTDVSFTFTKKNNVKLDMTGSAKITKLIEVLNSMGKTYGATDFTGEMAVDADGNLTGTTSIINPLDQNQLDFIITGTFDEATNEMTLNILEEANGVLSIDLVVKKQ
jgi:hypothetical protein